MSQITIKLVRSQINTTKSQKLVLRALGLRKINSTVVKENNPSTQGMINKVKHLVVVEK